MTADFVVIGAGIVGLAVARELKRRFGDCSVVVLEKESEIAFHASGRNSGVLHAGFYYAADSLKARLCRDGCAAMTLFCRQRGLRINSCGKLVVARDEQDFDGLDELVRRAAANGVRLERLSEAEARKIEPRVKTFQRALYSPTTATVDPRDVTRAFAADAEEAGARIRLGSAYRGRDGNALVTGAGRIAAGFVVNAAGLYADRVARDFGFSERYRILPFKGLYLYARERGEPLRTCIYPVPDLRNPFLGIHLTVTVNGGMKVGPTAIPALWREQYGGWGRFRLDELLQIASDEMRLLWRAGFDFRRLAADEARKYWRPFLVAQAARLARGIEPELLTEWGRSGIRAQLLDVKTRRLEMDWVIEGDSRSLHVLNAVSPAFTSAIPFSRFVADEICARLH